MSLLRRIPGFAGRLGQVHSGRDGNCPAHSTPKIESGVLCFRQRNDGCDGTIVLEEDDATGLALGDVVDESEAFGFEGGYADGSFEF